MPAASHASTHERGSQCLAAVLEQGPATTPLKRGGANRGRSPTVGRRLRLLLSFSRRVLLSPRAMTRRPDRFTRQPRCFPSLESLETHEILFCPFIAILD